MNNRLDQFAPRIGLAYDPKGDGKMSIRASFGISYDFPNIQIMSTPTLVVIYTFGVSPQIQYVVQGDVLTISA